MVIYNNWPDQCTVMNNQLQRSYNYGGYTSTLTNSHFRTGKNIILFSFAGTGILNSFLIIIRINQLNVAILCTAMNKGHLKHSTVSTGIELTFREMQTVNESSESNNMQIQIN